MHHCAGTLLVVCVVVAVVRCQQSQQDAAAAANSDSKELSALVAVCQRYPQLEVCADIVNNAGADDDDENAVEKRKGSFIRLGKRKGSFIRLGKRKGSFIRLG
uniref:Uncharacterized protein n=1 Tax=Plectus sambesii TaxID=2011161 RepID=A0A914V8C8_9BILA